MAVILSTGKSRHFPKAILLIIRQKLNIKGELGYGRVPFCFYCASLSLQSLTAATSGPISAPLTD